MTAVTDAFVLERPEPLPAEAGTAVSRAARGYVGALIALAGGLGAALYLASAPSRPDWTTFAILAAAATIAQTFPVKSPRNVHYHTSVVFLVAGALLLPPQLVLLIPLVQTVPEWLRERYPWPVQGFTVANYALDTIAAWGAADLVTHYFMPHSADGRFAAAGLAACLAFVAANQLLVAGRLKLGDGGGLFSVEGVSIDLVLTMLGVSLAAFWRWDPWLVFAALAPLVVVHRSLSVPQLQAEARVDPKTGLYNARYFATALEAELARAARFERPMAVIMADLDLLRDVNNTFGHLAGDAVLRGVADVFRSELRHYDVPARFGGEEFSILLPETTAEQAIEIADRIRRAVAERDFHVTTSTEPLRATLSMGVAVFPDDAVEANELVHQADLAVYRAKLQGRNRVLGASTEPLRLGEGRVAKLGGLRALPAPGPVTVEEAEAVAEAVEPRRRRELLRPRLERLRGPFGVFVALLVAAGAGGGMAGVVLGGSHDVLGLVALMSLVGGAQALAFEEANVAGSISVSVVGSLAGAAVFGYRAALPLALAAVVAEWSARRVSLRTAAYMFSAFTLAGLAATAVIHGLDPILGRDSETFARAVIGVVAGLAAFAVRTGLLGLASARDEGVSPFRLFRERAAWLLPHYVVYGFIGAIVAVAYDSAGVWALALFAVPLLVMRRTQEAYLRHTQRSSEKLTRAAETIRQQNLSLGEANRLLRERTTAAMESLSATVDARDKYTAGHARRVRELSLALGRELGLCQPELDLLDRAALFHDIGKLGVPDAILLKPGPLTPDEWDVMQTHAEEGARIIERLGFLEDAVPAIRHHHERFDGLGYPGGLAADEIPLGARIIHVADALDSMLTTRIYQDARTLEDAMGEIREAAGTQFCPRCVAALERLIPIEAPVEEFAAAS
ncbi:MAG: diguanylate cyclase [Actinobacteria bacterium]|nr:diguanylate cyclase [Actinomycetota bacterium]